MNRNTGQFPGLQTEQPANATLSLQAGVKYSIDRLAVALHALVVPVALTEPPATNVKVRYCNRTNEVCCVWREFVEN